MRFISWSDQLWALRGCSPPRWCFKDPRSTSKPKSLLSSKRWISANFLQCLMSFVCRPRKDLSRIRCASVFWLQFWRDVHGSHGGEKWTYRGLHSLTKEAARKNPSLLVRSYPLWSPIANARPPRSLTARHNGESQGAQTSNRSKLPPSRTSRRAWIPSLNSSWRCSMIPALKTLGSSWLDAVSTLPTPLSQTPTITSPWVWLSSTKLPALEIPLKMSALEFPFPSWWSCP